MAIACRSVLIKNSYFNMCLNLAEIIYSADRLQNRKIGYFDLNI